MATKVSLEEAVNTVETLDEIALPDYQPCIEAINGSIVYKVSLDTNFEDKTAYVTGISKYIEEAAMHAQLVTKFNKIKKNYSSFKINVSIDRINCLNKAMSTQSCCTHGVAVLDQYHKYYIIQF